MKVYFETLGCPKNFYDTENAKGILEDAGFEICDNPETADFVVVNTCGFINDAKTESIERIFDMASAKRDDAKLVVSGCLSKRYSEELFDEMPEADAFVGVNEYEKLPSATDLSAFIPQAFGKPGGAESALRKRIRRGFKAASEKA